MICFIKMWKKKFFNYFNQPFRNRLINPFYRWKLKNHKISLLSNNCNGACILHDLGIQLDSPFVNLWLFPEDFIKYCEDIDHYQTFELEFIDEWGGYKYPLAKLDDITIHFMHYHTEEEAKQKWIERSKRIKKENIFILVTERDGLTQEQMKRLNKLPYPKAILTHLPMPEIENTYYIRGFENEEQCGILCKYSMTKYPGYKWYDDFNFVKWFNNNTP